MHATTTTAGNTQHPTDQLTSDADRSARHDHRSQAAPCATCLSARRRLAAALVGLAAAVATIAGVVTATSSTPTSDPAATFAREHILLARQVG